MMTEQTIRPELAALFTPPSGRIKPTRAEGSFFSPGMVGRGERWSPEEEDAITRGIAAGLSAAEVAEDMPERSEAAVRSHGNAMGLRWRGRAK